MHCILRRCSVSQVSRFTKTDQIEKKAQLWGTVYKYTFVLYIRSHRFIFNLELMYSIETIWIFKVRMMAHRKSKIIAIKNYRLHWINMNGWMQIKECTCSRRMILQNCQWTILNQIKLVDEFVLPIFHF